MSNIEAERLIFSAGILVKDNRPGDAASLLQDCLLRFPDAGKAHALMGHIYDHFFHEPFTAEDHFKKAMLLAPDYTFTYLYYAEALLAQERYTEMTAMLNKSLETTAAAKNEIFNLFGLMNEKQSKYEEAVEDFQRAIIYCLDNDLIAVYQQSINRCIAKQKIYSGV
jgi:Tfp pilus assembly protein PilF